MNHHIRQLSPDERQEALKELNGKKVQALLVAFKVPFLYAIYCTSSYYILFHLQRSGLTIKTMQHKTRTLNIGDVLEIKVTGASTFVHAAELTPSFYMCNYKEDSYLAEVNLPCMRLRNKPLVRCYGMNGAMLSVDDETRDRLKPEVPFVGRVCFKIRNEDEVVITFDGYVETFNDIVVKFPELRQRLPPPQFECPNITGEFGFLDYDTIKCPRYEGVVIVLPYVAATEYVSDLECIFDAFYWEPLDCYVVSNYQLVKWTPERNPHGICPPDQERYSVGIGSGYGSSEQGLRHRANGMSRGDPSNHRNSELAASSSITCGCEMEYRCQSHEFLMSLLKDSSTRVFMNNNAPELYDDIILYAADFL